MAHTVTLIEGDGIGPEVTNAAVRVLEAAQADLEWERVEAGLAVVSKYGKPLPDHVIDSIQKNRVALKGPLTTIVAKGFPSVNVELRKKLNLYANLRPVHNIPGIRSRFQDVDLVVIRENTEDLYSGLEHTIAPGVTQSLKIITKEASQRIARFAFEYAQKWNRRKVTAVHKANIMKVSDGLFLETCQEIAKDYPEVEYQEVIVDNLAMQLVLNPQQYDILLLTNLYGDIVSDLCAGLVGGLGVVPGANIGDDCSVFEAVHGSAPDIAGKDIANPLALIFSSLLMLRHLDMNPIADRIRDAVYAVTSEGKILTPDLGGSSTTTEFTDAIISRL
ncbi:MAG TPA: isocitrate dehydrogenase (NAD(+)) [Acidobacteriota bacterium]|nr:isocitrate dehydrogenase (NAD(+)) [Acidobacteriota bacterium]